MDTRAALARKLAKRTTDKMQVEAPPGVSDETLLENATTGVRQITSIN
jgi:hypothetical protein